MSKELRSSVVMRGVEVSISPLSVNRDLGTFDVILAGVFQKLYLHPPYQAIRHILAGPNSTSK